MRSYLFIKRNGYILKFGFGSLAITSYQHALHIYFHTFGNEIKTKQPSKLK